MRSRIAIDAILVGASVMLAPVMALSQNSGSPPSAIAHQPPMSADQRKKLAQIVVEHGSDQNLFIPLTIAFGITKANEVLNVRNIGVLDPNFVRTYNPLPNGGLLLFVRFADQPERGLASFYFDQDLKLIGAIFVSSQNVLTHIPVENAEQHAQDQLTWWAEYADSH